MIIALEGIDCSAKSTHAPLLAKHLGGRSAAFPNYTSIVGGTVHSWLHGGWNCVRTDRGDAKRINAIVLQALMTINRYESLGSLREEADAGVLVLDRYFASGIAYGEADGLSRSWLMNIHRGLPEARAHILLDITVAESLKRRPNRTDQYEASVERLGAARQIYRKLFATMKELGQPWHTVDGMGEMDEVQQRIRAALAKELT